MEGQTRYGRKGLKAKDRWKWKVRFERTIVIRTRRITLLSDSGYVLTGYEY
ncbi:hypothetical protein CJQ79_003623 [Salmonella enterica subsp. enterica serovar Saintpaul]|nr:hypothetical protein [Salmonella enterica subsp. enterica serovar Saintpaul]